MEDNDFLNSLRKSVGLKTDEEKRADAEEQARLLQQRADDMPRRQALVQEFREKVDPALKAVAKEVDLVASEAHLQLIEFNVLNAGGNPDNVLAKRKFQLSRKPLGGQAITPGSASVPTLDFDLSLTGEIVITTGTKTEKLPIGSIQSDGVDFTLRVKRVFGDYFNDSANQIRGRS